MLYKEISCIRGVGAARLKGFHKLGIYRMIDFLWHIPRRYEDRRVLTSIANLKPGTKALISGKVISIESKRIRSNFVKHTAKISDSSGSISVVFFNQNYIVEKTEPGQVWFLFGRTEIFRGEKNFSLEEIDLRGKGSNIGLGLILPYYPATSSTPQKFLRRMISEFVRMCVQRKIDALKFNGYPDFSEAIRMVHLPQKLEEIDIGRKRMALDEFLIIRLCVERSRISRPQHKIREKKFKFNLELPYKLLKTQNRIIETIKENLQSDLPMRRLIEGDVGSGKTVLAIIAGTIAAEFGNKTAFLAPTEILAEQHYSNWKEILQNAGINSYFLTSEVIGSRRKQVFEAAVSDAPAFFFGTHALLSERMQFKNLGLVVIDEQQRFGVVQRDVILKKGTYSNITPDLLILSATPIPRTLAMTLYGDLEISRLEGLLPGREPVETVHFRDSERNKMMPYIRRALSKKERIYIVYPIIEENEELNIRDAKGQFEKISKAFPEYKAALLTGKTKSQEKEKIMRKFRDGEITILVSTSVIEVGIDVPEATLMIIEHAEYFGLAQLHQLRGRVGRGGRKGLCILTTADILNEYAEERIEAIVKCNDGFRIAEEDLRLRGPGEILGEKQHGGTELRVANLLVDADLIPVAQRIAREIIEEDSTLERHEFYRKNIEGFEAIGADVL